MVGIIVLVGTPRLARGLRFKVRFDPVLKACLPAKARVSDNARVSDEEKSPSGDLGVKLRTLNLLRFHHHQNKRIKK